jgi:hypothetical protein
MKIVIYDRKPNSAQCCQRVLEEAYRSRLQSLGILGHRIVFFFDGDDGALYIGGDLPGEQWVPLARALRDERNALVEHLSIPRIEELYSGTDFLQCDTKPTSYWVAGADKVGVRASTFSDAQVELANRQYEVSTPRSAPPEFDLETARAIQDLEQLSV